MRRLFRKREVRQRLGRVSDLRRGRGRRGALPRVLATVVGAVVLQLGSCHRLDERTRPGPPLQVAELQLAPLPDATLQGILPQLEVEEVRQVLVESVRAEVRRKSMVNPVGGRRTLAIDGTCLWRGRRGGCPACQLQGPVRGHRVMRALRPRASPRLFREQRPLTAAEHERGAFVAFWGPLLDTYARLHLFEVVPREAGSASLGNAPLIEAAGYGDGLGRKETQPGLLQEAQRLLGPLAATQRPEARVVDRDHGQGVRHSLWRTAACAGGLDWSPLRQVWLGRTAKCGRQTTPRPDRVPVAVVDHYSLTNLPWTRLVGAAIRGVVRGHGGIANHGFRTLDRVWQEEQAWCPKGTATDVLGLLRLWAYNVVGLLRGRYLRATRYRTLTLGGFVAWLERVSVGGQGRRRRSGMAPVG